MAESAGRSRGGDRGEIGGSLITGASISLPTSVAGVALREAGGQEGARRCSGMGWTGGQEAVLHLTPVGALWPRQGCPHLRQHQGAVGAGGVGKVGRAGGSSNHQTSSTPKEYAHQWRLSQSAGPRR